MNGQQVLAALLTGLAVGAMIGVLAPPSSRLGPRVRPYAIGSRSTLAGRADAGSLVTGGLGSSAVIHLFGPMLKRLADAIGGVFDGLSDEAIGLKLRQAGFFPELSPPDRVAAFRLRQLGQLVAWLGIGLIGGTALDLSVPQQAGFVLLAGVVGATRQRGKLDRAIEQRKERMRIEIYTVNQLLAIRIRAGGGVVHAVSQIVGRGHGEVVSELAEALRMHRAGTRASDAFRRIAELTPEPACARTYSLLAVSEERGADLAAGLLSLSEDIREARREGMRRVATKRRAAMLIPTIAILAPVMLLFVGAPLPSLLLGFR